jgi:glycerol-3-phosphate dehydrogenase (NAD(P)+)
VEGHCHGPGPVVKWPAMFRAVSIIGDGAMGTVLAMLLAEKDIPVRIWGYDGQQLEEFRKSGENKRFLPGYRVPKAVQFDSHDASILAGADLIVSAVPCQYMRGIWGRLGGYFRADVPIISVTKGIENVTLMRPSEILGDVLGTEVRCGVLSGPTIADELARRLPATACVASQDQDLAKAVQVTFNTDWFRVYTNGDLIGVEMASACKNVIAIAAGIIDGVGAGDNAKAALLSRGLAEISRLGLACGARAETFAGLAGLGDLVTTCISPKGRNRTYGERIGRGQSTGQALAATESVIEGVTTCESVATLARQKGVEMPITEAVHQVIFQHKPVHQAIRDLMARQLRAE